MLFLDSLHEGIHNYPYICHSEMAVEHGDEVGHKFEEFFDVGLEEHLTQLDHYRVKILLNPQTEAIITRGCLHQL